VRNREPVRRIGGRLGSGNLEPRIDPKLTGPVERCLGDGVGRGQARDLSLRDGFAEGWIIRPGRNVDLTGNGNDAVTQRDVRIQTGHF
jgi:hypothetical protein